MSWTLLHIIGIMAYAITGAFVAIEAEYSFIGVFVLGLATSFGGAIIRNLVIGAPVSTVWDPFTISLVLSMLILIVFMPVKWTHHWKKYGLFFDSIGLASFALQGALSAQHVHNHIGILLLAAVFTGLGGGMIRDVLAGKSLITLKEEIHAVLAALCGVCIWLHLTKPIQLSLIVFGVVLIRMFAIQFKLRLRLPCNRRSKTNFKAI